MVHLCETGIPIFMLPQLNMELTSTVMQGERLGRTLIYQRLEAQVQIPGQTRIYATLCTLSCPMYVVAL